MKMELLRKENVQVFSYENESEMYMHIAKMHSEGYTNVRQSEKYFNFIVEYRKLIPIKE